MKTRWVLSRSLTVVTVVLFVVTGSLVGCEQNAPDAAIPMQTD